VPELTLLCDAAQLAPSTPPAASHSQSVTPQSPALLSALPSASHQQSMTSEYIRGPPFAAAATHSIDAVSSSNSLSCTDTPQPLIPSPGVRQSIAGQPPQMTKKSHGPQVPGTNRRGGNAASPCCPHCTSAEGVPPSVHVWPSECGGTQNGQRRNVPRQGTADGCVQACSFTPAAYLSVQAPADVHSCAVSMQRMSNAVRPAAAWAQRQCQSQCSPVQHRPVAQLSHNGSAQQRPTVNAISLPGDMPSSSNNAEQPRQNVQHHQYTAVRGPQSTGPRATGRPIQPTGTGLSEPASRHSANSGSSSAIYDRSTSRPGHPAMPAVRFAPPVSVSQQTPYQQQLNMSPHVCMPPLSIDCDELVNQHCVECEQSTSQHCVDSPAATSVMDCNRSASQHCVKCDHSVSRHCVSLPMAASVMQYAESRHCAQSREPFTFMPRASQPGVSAGNAEAVGFSSLSGAQLLGTPSLCPQQQECMIYDSDQYSRHSCGRSVPVNCSGNCNVSVLYDGVDFVTNREDGKSQHHAANMGQHAGESQMVEKSHGGASSSSTPRVLGPGKTTVSDLLSSIPAVLDMDWSVALPPDVSTVDDFVQSVLLGQNTPSTDSGLQVNDSAVSSDTLPKASPPLATDDCNVLCSDADSMADRKDGFSQSHAATNLKKCRGDLDFQLTLCEEHLEKQRLTEKSELSRDDSRPKLCSVAVNTSLYWPLAEAPGYTPSQHNTPGASRAPLQTDVNSPADNTLAHVVNELAVLLDSGSSRSVTQCQRPIISDRDLELAETGNTYDSMTTDVSIGTPPLPMFPNPSEESVVSEMIMDMPEYTALSQEK